MIWPFEFSVEERNGVIEVLDPEGNVAVRSGERFELSGGSVSDDGYQVCMINGIYYR